MSPATIGGLRVRDCSSWSFGERGGDRDATKRSGAAETRESPGADAGDGERKAHHPPATAEIGRTRPGKPRAEFATSSLDAEMKRPDTADTPAAHRIGV
jgi:hypothetical protein